MCGRAVYDPAMFVETVTGTNGVLQLPTGYLWGLKELLSKYGILLVCDEVMRGFGRTGKMFVFEHDGIVPDILTMAKGLTSACASLGAVGGRIAEYYKTNVFMGGLSDNSHCVSLAAAEAAIQVVLDEKLVEHAATMQQVMRDEMNRLKERHCSVKEGRALGLFGMIDIQKNSAGESIAPYNGSHPTKVQFSKFLRDNGFFTFARWESFMCNPPLTITDKQLREGFAIIARGLEIADAVFEA